MRKRRRAVVLLMTLAMITLATLAMTRIANLSLEAVQQGILAHQALQHRWTERSCQIALLHRAEGIFAQRDQELVQRGAGWPLPRTVSLKLELGGESVTILMRDEQASVNLNQLHAHSPAQLPANIAQSALSSHAPVRLRPRDQSQPDPPVAFTSWGQVVDLPRASQRQSILKILAPINDTFTCWGPGRLNLRRASDSAVRLAVEPILDAVKTEELIQTRRGFDGELEAIWIALELHRTKQLQLNRVLGTESQCYSLWLMRPTRSRSHATLMVSQSGARNAQSDWLWRW